MYTVIEETGNKALEMQSIHERLEEIRVYLEKEIAFKQSIIEGQGAQITQLKSLSDDKALKITRLEDQLQECRQTNEGTRQLINKLLNDISNYQKDIEWYKRTYEKRSLAGTIWQKVFRK
ncbi:MAG TPA: hypothetical protein VNS58_04645 [Puia sp.]|nr:hypothetical protein [Puia sp.]